MVEGGNSGDVECNDGSVNSNWVCEGENTSTNQDNNNNDILGRKWR